MSEINFDWVRKIPDGEGGYDTDCYFVSIDGVECSVPMIEGNKEYDEIVKQVADGTLTIEEPTLPSE